MKLEKKVKKLQKANERLQSEYDKLDELQETAQELKTAKKEIKKLKKEIDRLKEAIEEDASKSAKQYNKKERQLKKEIDGLEACLEEAKNMNNKLSEDTQNLEQTLAKLQTKINAPEKPPEDLQSPILINDLSRLDLEAICESVAGAQIKGNGCGRNYQLTLDLSEPSCMELIKTLIKSKLPYLVILRLNKVPFKNEEIKQFLLNGFPNGVDQLQFNYDSTTTSPIDYYFKSLKALSKSVKTGLCLNQLEVSSDQFWELIDAYKHIEEGEIGFRNCEIATALKDNPCDLEGFKLATIDLSFK